MSFSDVNYLVIILGTIVSFAVGAFWYSPVMFSKIWQKEVGLTDKDMADANMLKIFGTTWVLTAIMGLGVALYFQAFDAGELTLAFGLTRGLMLGILFLLPSMGINIMYQRKSLTLWAIDAGYQILILGIFGAFLGLWG